MGVLVKNDDKKEGMNKWALRRLLSATLVSEARAENANVDTSNWLPLTAENLAEHNRRNKGMTCWFRNCKHPAQGYREFWLRWRQGSAAAYSTEASTVPIFNCVRLPMEENQTQIFCRSPAM